MNEKTEKGVLQAIDDDARRLAKTLVRSARFGALGVLDPGDGAPRVSRVSLATAIDGRPVFLISRLSAHFGALEADARASLLVGEPGKGDPLAHPRLTLAGRAERVAEAERASVRRRFLARHPKSALYVDFADFAFWVFTPERLSLNGGFGKAYEAGPEDLMVAMAGLERLAEMEAGAVAHMNADHGDAIEAYARAAGAAGGGWMLACLDPEGLDLVSGDRVQRVWFHREMRSPDDLRPILVELAKSAREE